jgi:hypothetical protein
MGLFDEIKDAAEQFNTRQLAESQAMLAASFPPGTPLPRTDLVSVSPRFRQATVAAYLTTVGLLPEDVYAVIPRHSNDVAVSYEFVYRDRPEYEAGRRNWAAAAG